MRATFPFPISQTIDHETEVQMVRSISVDPLVVDDLTRESASLSIIRRMEKRSFKSPEAAHRYMLQIMLSDSELTLPERVARLTDFERAKRLVAEAFENTDKSEQLLKAQEAMKLSAICAEAYIILAQQEQDPAQKVHLLEKGMEIAASQLDKTKFDEPDGYFWQLLVTRPYMRCRTALAFELWNSGEQDTAIEHIKTLLRLNSYDNQGLRLHLLSWLLEFNASDDSIDRYFTEFKSETSAFGRYAYLLWKFIRDGKSKSTVRAFDEAIQCNEFVPIILCREVALPDLKSKRVIRGTPQEAIAFRRTGYGAWQKAAGALSWLEEHSSSKLSNKSLLDKIESAEECKPSGEWVAPMPLELMKHYR